MEQKGVITIDEHTVFPFSNNCYYDMELDNIVYIGKETKHLNESQRRCVLLQILDSFPNEVNTTLLASKCIGTTAADNKVHKAVSELRKLLPKDCIINTGAGYKAQQVSGYSKGKFITNFEQQSDSGDNIQNQEGNIKRDYSLPKNLSHSRSFIPHSRDREVAIYMNILKAERRCFIYGSAGQGKSEVAIELGLQMPCKSYLIHWHNSMFDTISDLNFIGFNYQSSTKRNKKLRYEKNLEILMSAEFENVLLIFDNFYLSEKTLDELQSESAYKEVYNGLPSMLAFTTRYDLRRDECELKPLHEDILVEFMKKTPGCALIPHEKLKNIIRMVSGNILFIDLCAKTISCSWNEITADTIIDCIASSQLKSLQATTIRSDKEASKEHHDTNAPIYEHIKALFHISALGMYENKVMQYITVNPKPNISAVLFRACLAPDEKNALVHLIDSGWIKRTTDNTLIVHPLIRLVYKEELNPTDEKCEDFLSKLRKACQNLFFISGTAGAGKSTVLHIAMEKRSDIKFVPGVTTRAKRSIEIDGVQHPLEVEGIHYFFKSVDEFQEMIKRDLLLEYDKHAGRWYGTPRIPVEENLVDNIVFLDLEPWTVDKIKSRYPECTTIFIAPPSENELLRRLQGRGDIPEDQIRLRLECAKSEFKIGQKFDYVLTNNDSQQCAEEILKIVETCATN